jgi:hypothetical protein
MEASCEYIEQEVVNSRQGVAFSLDVGLTTHYLKKSYELLRNASILDGFFLKTSTREN